MTTDTEDLLWRRFNEWFRARRPDYPSEWDAYQAGHADAKAETADVGEPVAMVQCHGSAEHPLYTAEQLAAAVDAEREKCAGIVNELRMECARRNMPESATMLWHAEDAIRAGAKEPSDG